MKNFLNHFKNLLHTSKNNLLQLNNSILQPELKNIKTKIFTFLNTIIPKNLILTKTFKIKKVKPAPTLKDIISKAYIKNYEYKSSKPKSSDLIKWSSVSSDIRHPQITMEVLTEELRAFFEFYKESYPNHKYFAIVPKISLENGALRSFTKLQISTTKDFNQLLKILFQLFAVQNLNVKMSADDSQLFKDRKNKKYIAGKIIFTFKPLTDISETKYVDNERLDQIPKHFRNSLDHKGVKLPLTMDLTLWPNIHIFEDHTKATAHFEIKKDGNTKIITLMIEIREKENFITVNYEKKVLFTFTDVINNSSDLTDFTRTISEEKKLSPDPKMGHFVHILKKILYCFDGKAYFIIEDLHKNFILTRECDEGRSEKILTLDLETKNINGKLVPICMSFYDGEKPQSFIFKNHESWSEDMFNAFKENILIRKYDNYKIILHNFSNFDGIFMMDTLSRLGKIKPLTRDGKILQIKVYFNTFDKDGKESKKGRSVTFYDSYLLLPSSLDSLSKSFNIQNKKTFFPFTFIDDNNLDYCGEVPDYKYFTKNVSLEDYKNYTKNFINVPWDLSKELAIYCENDTIALHQIISKFSEEIYNLFQIDISKYPTLPSIAFGIYRSKHLPEDTVPIILGKDYDLIKNAYYGGITDVYKPVSEGKKIYSYDVNSLYPASMIEYPMPIGHPRYFNGDPYLIEKDPFGFFEVKVTAPNIQVPFLPTKKKISDSGIRTICPIGTWTGWYFSEEIKNAQKHGYSFEILQGYLFEKQIIFDSYITKLYEMKKNSNPSDPKYYIAKLLMNSLYGRFGMDPTNEVTLVVSHEESEKIISSKDCIDITPLLGSGNLILKYETLPEDDSELTNVSVPISAAISAYSRIKMSHFLVKYANHMYYIDTDGIKLDCEIDPSEIHENALGYMKQEDTFIDAIFALPKVYGGILEKPNKKGKTEIVKVKGVKDPIAFEDLKKILKKGAKLDIMQEKWKRDISTSSILITPSPYTLSLNNNKRNLLFKNGKLNDTSPIILKDGNIEIYLQ